MGRAMKAAPAVLGALGLAVSAGAALAADVKEIGSFHVGGEQLAPAGPSGQGAGLYRGRPTHQDGSQRGLPHRTDVRPVRQAGGQPKARYPLLLWHGGGLTGVTWETKPDGKPGWQMYFINAGHDVYVSDAVERGRASS